MTKLTPTQRDLLTLAAEADGGAIPAPEATKAASALIKLGLFMSVPLVAGGSQLLITQAGRALVGADDQKLPGDCAVVTPPAVSPAPASPAAASPKGKLGIVVDLLRRPNGVSLEELMSATGWQKHSVRGALSGAVKKKLGLAVISEKIDGARVYRIGDEAAA